MTIGRDIEISRQLAAIAEERQAIQRECDAMQPPYTPAQTRRRERLMDRYFRCQAADAALLKVR